MNNPEGTSERVFYIEYNSRHTSGILNNGGVEHVLEEFRQRDLRVRGIKESISDSEFDYAAILTEDQTLVLFKKDKAELLRGRFTPLQFYNLKSDIFD